jgi:hypothetical protein
MVREDLPRFVAPMLAREGSPTDAAGWPWTMCRAVVQFLGPVAASKAPRRQLRDANCSMCAPAQLAVRIWQRRYRAWVPQAAEVEDRDRSTGEGR